MKSASCKISLRHTGAKKIEDYFYRCIRGATVRCGLLTPPKKTSKNNKQVPEYSDTCFF